VIALLSPAKSLDFEKPLPDVATTEPRFEAEAADLATAAARLGPKKLAALMSISPKLARLNADRFKGFGEAEPRPAIYAFAGDVYQGFDVRSLDEAGLAFAQDHVRILSGLYGILRPLDRIRPYRLEMGTHWAPGRKPLLTDWWGTRVSDALSAELQEEGSGIVVNLASQEYWHVVAQAPPPGVRVVTVDFRDRGPKGLRFNTFVAKRARGAMARYLSEHRLSDPEGLKGFDWEGHAFDADASEGDTWRFVRAA
jgi:uncharacterized protein